MKKLKVLSAILLFVMPFLSAIASAAGDGTQNNPYTCADVIALNNPGTKAWIKGYIVGTMNARNNKNVFEMDPPFNYYANIYLADDPYETNPDNCVPVQLASGSTARAELNLGDNPRLHRCMFALQGDLIAYFGQPGLKNIDGYVALSEIPEEPDPGIGIDPELIFEVAVSVPGTLQNEFVSIDADVIQGLVIKGKLNSDDLIYLNSGTGRMASVKYLDLSEITIDYDGKQYSSRTVAPEAGMGTKYNYNYILSENNYDEQLPFDFVSGYTTNCYRNNLANAFCGNDRIESIVLPKCLTSIGEQMMYACGNLKRATILLGITEVGDGAFGECAALVVTEIPSTIERIGAYAFKSVTIKQDKLKFDSIFIGKGAFSDCKGFKALEITNPADTIPHYAFSNCTELNEIRLGEGLKYIGNNAFKYCNIVTADLPMSLEDLGEDVFLKCPFLSSLPTENYIRYLGSIAYELSDKTRSEYTVREGTKMLAPLLFWYAENQPRINLPFSLEVIGKQSLSGVNISSLPELPELRRIDDRAFEGCPLTSVVISEKVELIHYNAFLECSKIWKVTFNAIHASVVNNFPLFDQTIEHVELGDKVQHIPAGLYSDNTFTEIILPSSVVSLASGAFARCSKLERINLNDNISELPDNIFSGCTSLKEIHWPACLKRVGRDAFRDCSSLETISLPEGFTTLGIYAFSGCSRVKRLYIPSTLEGGPQYSYNFYIQNPTVEHFTVTCTADTPYNMGWSFVYMAKTTFKVPAESLNSYKSDPNWNGSCYPGYEPEVIAIGTISPPIEPSQTNFNTGISSDTDFSDAVVGDVYVTLGEQDRYDSSDGSIVLNEAMADEYVDAVGNMVPGQSDLANRFNGLVVQVSAGYGTIVIDCQTVGNKYISVKIGNQDPVMYSKGDKGVLTVEYDVAEDTYVYIFAAENVESPQSVARRRAVSPSDSCVKIYSIGITPGNTGMEQVFDKDRSEKSITDYWRLDGIKVDKPLFPGIYIGRCPDGSTVKMLIK